MIKTLLLKIWLFPWAARFFVRNFFWLLGIIKSWIKLRQLAKKFLSRIFFELRIFTKQLLLCVFDWSVWGRFCRQIMYPWYPEYTQYPVRPDPAIHYKIILIFSDKSESIIMSNCRTLYGPLVDQVWALTLWEP